MGNGFIQDLGFYLFVAFIINWKFTVPALALALVGLGYFIGKVL